LPLCPRKAFRDVGWSDQGACTRTQSVASSRWSAVACVFRRHGGPHRGMEGQPSALIVERSQKQGGEPESRKERKNRGNPHTPCMVPFPAREGQQCPATPVFQVAHAHAHAHTHATARPRTTGTKSTHQLGTITCRCGSCRCGWTRGVTMTQPGLQHVYLGHQRRDIVVPLRESPLWARRPELPARDPPEVEP